jgi:hypothetical protein
MTKIHHIKKNYRPHPFHSPKMVEEILSMVELYNLHFKLCPPWLVGSKGFRVFFTALPNRSELKTLSLQILVAFTLGVKGINTPHLELEPIYHKDFKSSLGFSQHSLNIKESPI